MFDLEKAIADWRKQMLVAGIKTPVPLEELESHLREEIQARVGAGLTAQHAFQAATTGMGQAPQLKIEFKKIAEPLEGRLVKLLSSGCALTAFAFTLWIFLTLFLRESNWQAKFVGLTGVATAVLAWKYNNRFLPVVHKRFTRATIGFVCCLGCVVWILFFIRQFAPLVVAHPEVAKPPVGIHSREGTFGPRFTGANAPPGPEPTALQTSRLNSEQPSGLAMAAFLWGWTLMALLGSVGHGLEIAAHRRKEMARP